MPEPKLLLSFPPDRRFDAEPLDFGLYFFGMHEGCCFGPEKLAPMLSNALPAKGFGLLRTVTRHTWDGLFFAPALQHSNDLTQVH